MNDTLVDYCERLQSGAEPWNVLSNLAFAFCGIAILRWRRRRAAGPHAAAAGSVPNGTDGPGALNALALLPFAIAAGSALYHARPSALTQALDVAPIALYVALALTLALRRVFGLSRPRRAAALSLWLAASAFGAGFPDVLAGSLLYGPTLLALLLLTWLARAGHRRRLAATSAAFAAALAARAADLPLCPVLPFGTHVLWHALAALAAWFAFTVVATAGSASSGASPSRPSRSS